MLSKIKRFIRTISLFPFIVVLILVLSLPVSTAVVTTFLGWPEGGTFQIAVDKDEHMRLLSQNPTRYDEELR